MVSHEEQKVEYIPFFQNIDLFVISEPVYLGREPYLEYTLPKNCPHLRPHRRVPRTTLLLLLLSREVALQVGDDGCQPASHSTQLAPKSDSRAQRQRKTLISVNVLLETSAKRRLRWEIQAEGPPFGQGLSR